MPIRDADEGYIGAVLGAKLLAPTRPVIVLTLAHVLMLPVAGLSALGPPSR